eukprot:364111-Chlamydomonas_euryale.AAC.26
MACPLTPALAIRTPAHAHPTPRRAPVGWTSAALSKATAWLTKSRRRWRACGKSTRAWWRRCRCGVARKGGAVLGKGRDGRGDRVRAMGGAAE